MNQRGKRTLVLCNNRTEVTIIAGRAARYVFLPSYLAFINEVKRTLLIVHSLIGFPVHYYTGLSPYSCCKIPSFHQIFQVTCFTLIPRFWASEWYLTESPESYQSLWRDWFSCLSTFIWRQIGNDERQVFYWSVYSLPVCVGVVCEWIWGLLCLCLSVSVSLAVSVCLSLWVYICLSVSLCVLLVWTVDNRVWRITLRSGPMESRSETWHRTFSPVLSGIFAEGKVDHWNSVCL